MKLAKSIFYSTISLAMLFGGAHASSGMSVDSAIDVAAMFEVDENHDGRTDRMLELEQSDSLA